MTASQSKRGRGDALTGEQALQIAIVKFREGLDYRDLAHSVEDSTILRGKEHFSAYIGWAVLACNLTQFVRKV